MVLLIKNHTQFMFKIGDKIRCINDREDYLNLTSEKYNGLTVNKVYTVLDYGPSEVAVVSDKKFKRYFNPARFVLYNPKGIHTAKWF